MRNYLDKAVIFLASVGAGYGPAHGAALSGVVTEESVPLAQVEVLLVNAGNNVIQDNAYSDETGGFRFAVKPGVFNLGTFRAGYASNWTKGNRSRRYAIEPAKGETGRQGLGNASARG